MNLSPDKILTSLAPGVLFSTYVNMQTLESGVCIYDIPSFTLVCAQIILYFLYRKQPDFHYFIELNWLLIS